MKGDPSMLDHDSSYLSPSVASAPPMAQLVHNYSDPAKHQQPLLQPLLEHPSPPVKFIYEPPSYNEDNRRESCGGMICKLFIFHFLNALLGIVAFVVVAFGIVLSLVFLPFCCCGIVACAVVLDMVRYCAQLDVELHNYIASPKDQVFLNLSQRVEFYGPEAERLAPSLLTFSVRTMLVVLYFLTFKVVISLLSLVVFVVSVALTCVCLVVLSIPLMYITAGVSRVAMRTFCCERFSTHGYTTSGVRVEVDLHAGAKHHGWNRV